MNMMEEIDELKAEMAWHGRPLDYRELSRKWRTYQSNKEMEY
ncbi:MAG: hypothetical protein ACTSUB_08990 [Candidatus Thorarchaeota archaeon]